MRKKVKRMTSTQYAEATKSNQIKGTCNKFSKESRTQLTMLTETTKQSHEHWTSRSKLDSIHRCIHPSTNMFIHQFIHPSIHPSQSPIQSKFNRNQYNLVQSNSSIHPIQPSIHTYIHTYILSLIHISEPTRRRGISYAVFCLKKKKK